MNELLRRFRDEVGDTSVLGRVRAVVGMILLANALREVHALRQWYFGDFFHWPVLPEEMVPSHSGYVAIVAVQLLLSVLVIVGYRARIAIGCSGLLELYVLMCDRLHFHHNRYALSLYAVLLSLAPCDGAFRLGPPEARVGPLWAARLAGLQLSLIYLASGGSKLFDSDWRGGAVLLERLRMHGPAALAAAVPAGVVDALMRPEVASGLAKLAIATELCLAFGLWSRRTRVAALWWGVSFHLFIEATARVEGFSWLTIGMYGVFVVPDFRARRFYYDRSSVRGRLCARAVTWLDWLERLDVQAREASDEDPRQSVAVVRRDGSIATGFAALVMVARCTPLLFPLWAPLALAAKFSKRSGGIEGRPAE